MVTIRSRCPADREALASAQRAQELLRNLGGRAAALVDDEVHAAHLGGVERAGEARERVGERSGLPSLTSDNEESDNPGGEPGSNGGVRK